MKIEYKTTEHYKKMEELFPWWIERFSRSVWNDWMSVAIEQWEYENKDGLQLSLNYPKEYLADNVVSKLDVNLKNFMACKLWIFLNWNDIVFSSIQWQSFSDKLAQLFLTKNIDQKSIKSEKDFKELIKSYWEQKDVVHKKIVKFLGMPQHDFLFLLSSLVGIALWWENIKFIKKTSSWSIYFKQDETRDKKLSKKFPDLKDLDYYVYRNKDDIIKYISKMPNKQQELLFNFFDSLTEYINTEKSNPIKDLTDNIKWELIWAIKESRRNNIQ